MSILSNIPTLIAIVLLYRPREIYLPDCNVLVVIGVFDYAQGLWISCIVSYVRKLEYLGQQHGI